MLPASASNDKEYAIAGTHRPHRSHLINPVVLLHSMVHMIALNCHLISSSYFARGLYRDTSVKPSIGDDLVCRIVRFGEFRERERWRREGRGGVPSLRCAFSSQEEAGFGGITGLRKERRDEGGGWFEYLVKAHGWGVRRLIEDGVEMRAVARIQAEAFHEPVALFNDLFFQFFQVRISFDAP